MPSTDAEVAPDNQRVAPAHAANAKLAGSKRTRANSSVDGAEHTAEHAPLAHIVNDVPQWVTRVLQVPAAEVKIMETSSMTMPHYSHLLEYLAHRAVDVSFAPVPEKPVEDRKPLKSRRLEALRREFPGTLSALATSGKSDLMFSCPPSEEETRPKARNEGSDEEESEPEYPSLHLGLGTAQLRHDGQDVCVLHAYSGCKPSQNTAPLTLKVVYLYARHADTLRSLVNEVAAWSFKRSRPNKKPREGKYQLYVLEQGWRGGEWKYQGWKKSRALDTIFLDDGMMDNIVDDFRRFTSKESKKFYRDHGIPHRRSYIFYGPAGTGKTSTIRALAGALNLSACFCELGDATISNTQFQEALRTMPLPAMLVIEDIDAVFRPDRQTMDDRSLITFSGVLNALDGLVSVDGVLTVLTTNHLDRLDPALIRAGRIDRRFKFEPPKNKQIAAMFRSFYPREDDKKLAQTFADAVMQRPEKEARSIATLVEHMLRTREMSATESVQYLDTFFKKYYSDSTNNVNSIYS